MLKFSPLNWHWHKKIDFLCLILYLDKNLRPLCIFIIRTFEIRKGFIWNWGTLIFNQGKVIYNQGIVIWNSRSNMYFVNVCCVKCEISGHLNRGMVIWISKNCSLISKTVSRFQITVPWFQITVPLFQINVSIFQITVPWFWMSSDGVFFEFWPRKKAKSRIVKILGS